MDRYYYLAAQLPLLKFGQESFVDRASFLAQAEKWLSEDDFLVLFGASIDNFSKKKAGSCLGEYTYFEYKLRHEVSLFRQASRQKQTYKSQGLIGQILVEGNPLEVELALLKLRWDFLEEKEIGHYFDLDFIVLYFLKIQILERISLFNKEKGKNKFSDLTEVKELYEQALRQDNSN